MVFGPLVSDDRRRTQVSSQTWNAPTRREGPSALARPPCGGGGSMLRNRTSESLLAYWAPKKVHAAICFLKARPAQERASGCLYSSGWRALVLWCGSARGACGCCQEHRSSSTPLAQIAPVPSPSHQRLPVNVSPAPAGFVKACVYKSFEIWANTDPRGPQAPPRFPPNWPSLVISLISGNLKAG